MGGARGSVVGGARDSWWVGKDSVVGRTGDSVVRVALHLQAISWLLQY